MSSLCLLKCDKCQEHFENRVMMYYEEDELDLCPDCYEEHKGWEVEGELEDE